MNKQEAKQVLLLYRPGMEPDTELKEAMAVAQLEPELQEWFKQHCTFQEALRRSFRQVPVPEGLKEQILSERKAYFSPALTRRASLIAACGLFLALLATVWFSARRPVEDRTFANFQSRMVRTVARAYPQMDLETNDLQEIRKFLVQQHAPGDYQLPAGLQKADSTGCAVLRWQDKPVSMVCFSSVRNVKTPDLFLFVIQSGDAPKAPTAGPPQFSQVNGLATASWTQGDKTYLLASSGNEALVRKYLE